MGDGRIFLKNLSKTSFNKDLSNVPNFSLIHLAGQYTFKYSNDGHTWVVICVAQYRQPGTSGGQCRSAGVPRARSEQEDLGNMFNV